MLLLGHNSVFIVFTMLIINSLYKYINIYDASQVLPNIIFNLACVLVLPKLYSRHCPFVKFAWHFSRLVPSFIYVTKFPYETTWKLGFWVKIHQVLNLELALFQFKIYSVFTTRYPCFVYFDQQKSFFMLKRVFSSFSVINVKKRKIITKKHVIKGGLPAFRCYS